MPKLSTDLKEVELEDLSGGRDSAASFPRASDSMDLGEQEHPGRRNSRRLSIRHNPTIQNPVGLSNVISNTKYTAVTWLPKSILEQFRRFANLYFLFISILMFIGTYAPYIFQSPIDPYSTVITVIVILLATSIKEGLEDLQRARTDKEENTRLVTVVHFDHESNQPVEQIIESQHIKAGDIIKMTGKCVVPADMLLIMTSNHKDGNNCYIETANIDGETNLKVREAAPRLAHLTADGVLKPEIFTGTIEVEPPNKDIHTFVGALTLSSMQDPIPLDNENVLLRGSLFSNTDWAYGIAVYTGQESKLQMNSRHAGFKRSKMELYVNRAITMIFTAQVIMTTISVISIYALHFDDYSKLPYIFLGGDRVGVLPLWLAQWFIFFLLYNNFIPTSLYVTLEFVNLGQAYFIAQDLTIYDPVLDCPCQVRASNMSQELGVVSNVFSDKTGTLTRNEMRFVKFVINGTMYDIPQASALDEMQESEGSGNGSGSPSAATPRSPGAASKAVINALLSKDQTKTSKLYSFFRCLTTCHTVVREQDGTYRAESPDELALVTGVSPFECQLRKRGTATMNVEMLGESQRYDILAVNAFNADRKRMSILLKDVVTKEYYLMCKGADNVMLPLCEMDSVSLKSCEKSLFDLACLGLRTLVVAHKKLTETEALEWLGHFKAAASALENRVSKMTCAAIEIESHLTLLGITAIEDRLQDEVPEVIADLAKAGIVVWMLTGDKEETAVNIGRSCNLILMKSKLFFITNLDTKNDFNDKLKGVYDDMMEHFVGGKGYVAGMKGSESMTLVHGGIDHDQGDDADDGQEVVLVLDGPSFKFFDFERADHKMWFLYISKHVRSVIACRLTPVQKQQLVGFVKTESKPQTTTLAIGDGANDVSMIREADVGVGIFGKEGRQAANNAEFAIGQFKFLRQLLFVHGRWNYSRLSIVFLYSMHKNMTYVLTLFWFSYFAALSGTSPYESWIYNGFNFVLGLPIIFYGFQDRDLSAAFALANPQVYSTGRENVHMSHRAIAQWILNSIVYGVVLCLVFYYALNSTFQYAAIYDMGTTVFTALVMTMQLKVAFLHHQWTYPQVIAMATSVVGMLIYFILISVAVEDFYGEAQYLYSLFPLFWFFGFFMGPMTAFLVDPICYYICSFFFPTKEMYYRESEHYRRYEQEGFCQSKQDLPKHQIEHVSSFDLLVAATVGPAARKPSNDNFEMPDLYSSGNDVNEDPDGRTLSRAI